MVRLCLHRMRWSSDEEQFRKVVGEFLQGAGYRVTLCESGDKAIQLASKPFDVIISDVRLGYGPDGLDVLAAFQKHQAQTPVMLMTAFGDVENAMKAIQQGAYDYISKFPFQPQELLQCVARSLERRRLAEEGRQEAQRSARQDSRDCRAVAGDAQGLQAGGAGRKLSVHGAGRR